MLYYWKFQINMAGGYYDAGDNVKFSFPMAFTMSMLGWSVLEFGDLMGSELQNAWEAIRWGSVYFLKATKYRNVVVAQVGNPNADHDCWERPEDMESWTLFEPRTLFLKPEIAAALEASSLAFRIRY
ncbi:hypothetical protein AAZV13_09G189400 [Glycine max]